MPIHGYPGNIITANPTAPTVSSASGVWTTEQQMQYQTAGNWPMAATQISRSLRFNSADSTNLNRTYSGTGTSNKIKTLSMWVKRSSFGTEQRLANSNTVSATSPFLRFDTGDTLSYNSEGASNTLLTTTQVFRDPSAWYHIVLAIDTTQATASNRVKIYINGTQVTAFSAANYPTQNATSSLFEYASADNRIGSNYVGTTLHFNGYLTEINFIDGQALTPANFGFYDSNTGIWTPRQYTGTYGTNGFYLNFSDNSGTTATTLGKDYSGNGNNWTPNNFSVTAGAGNDSLVDTPTSYGTDTGAGGEVRGNYCTLNPLSLVSPTTLANGNLDSVTGTTGGGGAFGTMAFPSSGKWYFEYVLTATSGTLADNGRIGIAVNGTTRLLYQSDGKKNVDGTQSAYGASWTTNDVISVAVDVDAGTVTFYKNNSSQGSISYATSTIIAFPYTEDGSGTISISASWNFGQRPFAYTAPSGFKALCTQNLPTPTIGATSTTQANYYFDVLTWTSTGTTQTITGTQFQPDLAWTKARSSTSGNVLNDAVRGASKYLISYSTGAETTDANFLTSFNSNGLTFGTGQYALNTTVVGWLWRAAGSTVSNTAGTITSTVSANTTSGFSIVTYTGTAASATVGHGLGVKPAMIIIKKRTSAAPGGARGWAVWHQSLATDKVLQLNTTAAQLTEANFFIETNINTTTFGVGADYDTGWTDNYVAYCFAPVAGYSAFGSFTGNGSTDGPFVYLGFRPRWVLIKSSSAVTNWWVWDTARNTYNVMNTVLYPDLSNAEYSDSSTFLMDDLSNGFKYRTSNSTVNGSGTTYIYAAFAESPFKYSLAR